MSEHEWVVECVAQFLRSPLWTTPVHDFIDEHCILFSGTSDAGTGPLGEQSIEHTTIHNRFRELVDNLVTEYIEELGVPAEDVLRACETTESADGAKFLEYMYALDKYETFVLLMARRNAELEAEALRQLNASVSRATVSSSSQAAPEEPSKDVESGASAPEQGAEDDDEDADLKAAIEASLKESAGASAQREAELEDAELQRALQLSLAMEDQRKARELELLRLEEEELAKSKAEAEALAATAAAAAAAPAPPVVEAAVEAPKKEKKTEAQVHEESAQRQEAIKSTVHQARVENAERAVAPRAPAQKPVAAVEGAMSPLNTSPSQGGVNQAPPAPQQDAPAPMPAPLQATPAPAPAMNAKPVLPGLGSLRAGRSGASFGGFAKLPSIGGPAPATAMSFDELKTQAAQAKGEAVPAGPSAPESEEAIRLRAEHMRKQREKLMALKKQERQNDLEKFRTENGGGAPAAAAAASPAKDGTDAQHQDLTRQLARRFRTDIASTAKQ